MESIRNCVQQESEEEKQRKESMQSKNLTDKMKQGV